MKENNKIKFKDSDQSVNKELNKTSDSDNVLNDMDNVFKSESIAKSYLHFALPIVMGMVVSLIYNMIDTYFIAKTGNTNLIAGVSICAPIFTMMIAIGDIFGLGGSSAISRLFGQKKTDRGRNVSVFCFYSAIITGLIVTVLLFVFKLPILNFLGADKDTIVYAEQYFFWISFGAPFVVLNFTPTNQLRTEGFAVESMIGSILGTVVNIILDPIFILVLGWGAAGAAIATVIGNIATALYFAWILHTKTKVLSMNPRYIKVSGTEVKNILIIGIPASVTNLMQSFSVAVTNRHLLMYGNDKIAAMGIVTKIYMIVALVLIGLAFGGQPLFGYHYGARNNKKLKDIIRFSYVFVSGVSIIMASIIAVAGTVLVSCFVKDPELIHTGVQMLRIQLSSIVFMSISLVSICIFQSTGKAFGAFILSFSRQGILFFVVIIILSNTAGYLGILLSQPVSDLLTAAAAMALMYNGLGKELKN